MHRAHEVGKCSKGLAMDDCFEDHRARSHNTRSAVICGHSLNEVSQEKAAIVADVSSGF